MTRLADAISPIMCPALPSVLGIRLCRAKAGDMWRHQDVLPPAGGRALNPAKNGRQGAGTSWPGGGALPGMQPVCTQLYNCTLHTCTLYSCTLYTCTLYSCTLYICTLYNCTMSVAGHGAPTPGARRGVGPPGPPRKGASAGILLPSCKVQGAKVLSPWHLEGGVAG